MLKDPVVVTFTDNALFISDKRDIYHNSSEQNPIRH